MSEELSKKNIRRRPIAFNMDSALDRGLSEWCDQQSPDNFSGFVKMVLFAYKNNPSITPLPITKKVMILQLTGLKQQKFQPLL